MSTLSYIGLITNFLPAILGLRWYRSMPSEVRWFVVMLWIIAINGVLGLSAESFFNTNMPFFHFYILVETAMLIKVFSKLLSPFIRLNVLYTITVGFIVIWCLNVTLGDGITGYPTSILGLRGVILITLSLSWFVKVQREKVVQHPEKLFAFWLSTGVLIFFSGNLLLFMFSNFIFIQEKHVYIALWGTHAILVILLYLIYTIAIIWAHKNPTSY